MPVTCFAEALTVTQMQIERSDGEPPRTESERRLREYAGDPAEVARAAAGHDVLVVHGAPVSAEALAVADLTIAFALMLIRGVPRASRHLADSGTLSESVYDGREFFGREAPGTVLGLVGLGHVGRNVASRALALSFDVIAHDPVTPAIVPVGVRLVSLDRLLADADIVSVHARATVANWHMFSAPVFAQMKLGASFINTARESLVDEDALAGAVRSGALAGAALDVMERPAAGTRHPLLDLPQVFITPHIGGATQETLDRGARQAAAAVAAILAGQHPDAVVNPEVFDQ